MKPDVSALIEREGKYSNHKSDTGGETMWGITVSVARENGYKGEMRTMPIATAEQIYLNQYWYKPQFSKVAELSELIADELFDTGVNMGIGKAGEFLQITLNALNKGATIYPDVKEDGQIGSVTIEMLRRFLNARGKEGEKVMLTALNCLQGSRYIDLGRGRAANEDFVYGWILHRVKT